MALGLRPQRAAHGSAARHRSGLSHRRATSRWALQTRGTVTQQLGSQLPCITCGTRVVDEGATGLSSSAAPAGDEPEGACDEMFAAHRDHQAAEFKTLRQ